MYTCLFTATRFDNRLLQLLQRLRQLQLKPFDLGSHLLHVHVARCRHECGCVVWPCVVLRITPASSPKEEHRE